MNMSKKDEAKLASYRLLTDLDEFDKIYEAKKIVNKEAAEKKKVRRLERLTRDLTPEGWKILSAELDTYNEDFMRKYADCFQWHFLSIGSKLSERFIREMADYVDWTNICTWKRLTEEFIREFQDRVNWHMVSRYQKLSWKFIKEFQDKINFNMLTINEHIQGDIWKKCDENNYFKD